MKLIIFILIIITSIPASLKSQTAVLPLLRKSLSQDKTIVAVRSEAFFNKSSDSNELADGYHKYSPSKRSTVTLAIETNIIWSKSWNSFGFSPAGIQDFTMLDVSIYEQLYVVLYKREDLTFIDYWVKETENNLTSKQLYKDDTALGPVLISGRFLTNTTQPALQIELSDKTQINWMFTKTNWEKLSQTSMPNTNVQRNYSSDASGLPQRVYRKTNRHQDEQ
jgi:hypothetical protein